MTGKAKTAVLLGESGDDIIRKLIPIGCQQVPSVICDVPAEMVDAKGMAVLVCWFKVPGGKNNVIIL